MKRREILKWLPVATGAAVLSDGDGDRLGLLPTALGQSSSNGGNPNSIRRTLLARADIPALPDWETRIYLVEYAPGISAPVHHHSALGVGYVLDGTVLSAFSNQPVQQYETGQAFVDELGVPHTTSKNANREHPLKLLIAYTARKGSEVTITP